MTTCFKKKKKFSLLKMTVVSGVGLSGGGGTPALVIFDPQSMPVLYHFGALV
jgi:hypothetical protein